MFRLLFNSKKNAAGKGPSQTFRVYAGEFILVFLGILVALQVENWNQDWQEKKMEWILLTNQIVINFLDGVFPYNDSLESHLGKLNSGTIFNENLSAFETPDTTAIQPSNSFRSAVLINSMWTTYQLRSYQTAKKGILHLIYLIEKELS